MKKTIKNLSKRTCLVILDGFGISENNVNNAIKSAKTENIDHYFKHYPFTTIDAGGTSVGLPKGVCGNSEVGHMNLGAGRAIRQDFVRINEAIVQNSLQSREQFQELINKTKNGSNRVHIMGLLSDGGVHSHIDHIKEVSAHLIKNGCEVFFHAFMDGRDTPPKSGKKYIDQILSIKGLTFASMQGRSIGMDRDRRWEKTQACYDMLTGMGKIKQIDPLAYLSEQYDKDTTDEFIEPILFEDRFKMMGDDTVFFINFRPDRAIQLSLSMNDSEFKQFPRKWIPPFFLCMTPYVQDEIDLPILFNKERVKGSFSEYLSSLGHHQFKIAETEKYAHITFFFNGGRKDPYENETQVIVPSPRDVSTYDQKPEMSAPQVTDKLLNALDNEKYSFYLANFANSDMVGHTGKFDAAVKAIEALDKSVGLLAEKCLTNNITLIITADHGNSDQMTYENGEPHTSHTNAPVPFSIIHSELKDIDLTPTPEEHALKDVIPTIVNIMGIEPSLKFTGKSIFE